MKIALITPAAPGTRHGNRSTAMRWAGMLRELGHHVDIETDWGGVEADVMIALHARRSHASIRNFTVCCPHHPIILALTGTDLYRDIRTDEEAQESLRLATRMIVLQEMGLNELTPALRKKTTVIHQHAKTVTKPAPLKSCFEVIVSGHLRDEKDPFRAAAAAALLPADSRIRITHIGDSLSAAMTQEAQRRMKQTPRYRWLGSRPHGEALRLLARARLMVISSRMEGGANVVSEALANNTPVIASRISGNIGMLGRDYPGYYALEDERALAKLLLRAETDPAYLQTLTRLCRARKPTTAYARERDALGALVREVTP